MAKAKKQEEYQFGALVEKAPTDLHEIFAEWLENETGYDGVDLKTVQLVTVLRGDFQRSPENKQRIADSKVRREQEIEERAAKREEREAKRAADKEAKAAAVKEAREAKAAAAKAKKEAAPAKETAPAKKAASARKAATKTEPVKQIMKAAPRRRAAAKKA